MLLWAFYVVVAAAWRVLFIWSSISRPFIYPANGLHDQMHPLESKP